MLKTARIYWVEGFVCVAAVVGFVFASEAELFEAFFEFSRHHEDWDLDEIVLVYAIGAAVLPFLLFRANTRLRRAIAEASSAKKRAQHAARHDPLTGLYNRRYFNELLDIAIETQGPDKTPTVLLLDLDRFKAINDLRGHACGDRVLQAITEKLRRCCDDRYCAARLGGDEFAILMDDTDDYADATSLARRLLTDICEPIVFSEWTASVGCSIGICHWKPGDNAQMLLRNADQAMYKAKNQGRGCYAFFDKNLGDELQRQAQLETELKVAVKQMDIEPHFQPIVNIDDGSVCGFEVLSRWTSPILGPVRPDEFIQIAEDIGLIGPITWQVMRKALLVASQWDDDLFIAFNLSPHLFDEDLLDNIKWQLSEANFCADRIEIEITENAVIGNMSQAKEALDAIKDLGIRISLDDFGTGFSSLATLSHLPVDKIKIDKSFVSDVEAMPQNAKIVSAILALAQSMELTVTAEGIETDEELQFLSVRSCRQGQGYLFAKAMSGPDVSGFLAKSGSNVVGGLARKAS